MIKIAALLVVFAAVAPVAYSQFGWDDACQLCEDEDDDSLLSLFCDLLCEDDSSEESTEISTISPNKTTSATTIKIPTTLPTPGQPINSSKSENMTEPPAQTNQNHTTKIQASMNQSSQGNALNSTVTTNANHQNPNKIPDNHKTEKTENTQPPVQSNLTGTSDNQQPQSSLNQQSQINKSNLVNSTEQNNQAKIPQASSNQSLPDPEASIKQGIQANQNNTLTVPDNHDAIGKQNLQNNEPTQVDLTKPEAKLDQSSSSKIAENPEKLDSSPVQNPQENTINPVDNQLLQPNSNV